MIKLKVNKIKNYGQIKKREYFLI